METDNIVSMTYFCMHRRDLFNPVRRPLSQIVSNTKVVWLLVSRTGHQYSSQSRASGWHLGWSSEIEFLNHVLHCVGESQ